MWVCLIVIYTATERLSG